MDNVQKVTFSIAGIRRGPKDGLSMSKMYNDQKKISVLCTVHTVYSSGKTDSYDRSAAA
jgi:hypothetical protein